MTVLWGSCGAGHHAGSARRMLPRHHRGHPPLREESSPSRPADHDRRSVSLEGGGTDWSLIVVSALVSRSTGDVRGCA